MSFLRVIYQALARSDLPFELKQIPSTCTRSRDSYNCLDVRYRYIL